jgi:diguanylate cyclase (GGDEF)-like protein
MARPLSRTDELNGLANRRAMISYLSRALRSTRPLTLILLDLDGFKAVNDTHGHAAGDQVLRVIGARMGTSTSANSLVARLGGDEFTILCPGADAASITKKIRQPRAELARSIPTDWGRLTVHASIGTTIRNPGDVVPTDLLRRADAATYRAKAKSRAARPGHCVSDRAGPATFPRPEADPS